MSFEQLGLRAELLSAVRSQGYEHPTPIQARSIPPILEGRDVLGRAQTGTGKTAAFAFPILQRLSRQSRKERRPRALILAPTRELAAQVAQSISTYGKGLRLRSTAIFGGVGIGPQIGQFRRGVDILVATPGRLLDHTGRGTLDLSCVEILVLDEADRMLDMGFIPDIRRILKLLPPERQNMLFSATFSDEIKRLAQGVLRDPAKIEVSPPNSTVETVEQVVHPVTRARKRALLSHLIKQGDWRKVLVFTRTKHGANRLAKQLLSDGVSATAIHGDKSQSARTRALKDFKKGVVRTLVATDVASRGLDIDQLPHVVNFELPHVPEDYIHRIGRTGRAGANGMALSMVCAEERKLLIQIQNLLRRKILVEEVAGFEQPGFAAPARAIPSAQRPQADAGKRGGFKRRSARPRRARSAGRRS